LFKIRDFKTLEEAEIAIREFIELYNKEWMLERLGYLSPMAALDSIIIFAVSVEKFI